MLAVFIRGIFVCSVVFSWPAWNPWARWCECLGQVGRWSVNSVISVPTDRGKRGTWRFRVYARWSMPRSRTVDALVRIPTCANLPSPAQHRVALAPKIVNKCSRGANVQSWFSMAPLPRPHGFNRARTLICTEHALSKCSHLLFFRLILHSFLSFI